MGTILKNKTELSDWVFRVHGNLVVTNGCFDLLHAGHVDYLERSRSLGDKLLVGLNDDAGVRVLKGMNRPFNTEADRAKVLAALKAVNAVFIFQGEKAVDFLGWALPDIYSKGADYSLETLNKEELDVLKANRAKIVFLPFMVHRSTTELVRRIKES